MRWTSGGRAGALATCFLWLAASSAWAGELFKVAFGSGAGEEVACAFVLEGGKEAVGLGLAGLDLGTARPLASGPVVERSLGDPTSRLVWFRVSEEGLEGWRLARVAPVGGVLRSAGDGAVQRIEARVERHEGRYLPFTLLRLRTEGSAPLPGTPLLDGSGAVVAVVHRPVPGGGYHAIPVEVVSRVLHDLRRGSPWRRARLGLVLSPASGSARVVRTTPSGPAAKAGVIAGDLLLEIGGRRVADYGDAVNAFFLQCPGEDCRLRVKRGEVERLLTVSPADPDS